MRPASPRSPIERQCGFGSSTANPRFERARVLHEEDLEDDEAVSLGAKKVLLVANPGLASPYLAAKKAGKIMDDVSPIFKENSMKNPGGKGFGGSAPRGVDWDAPVPAPQMQKANPALASPYLVAKKAGKIVGDVSPVFRNNSMKCPGQKGFGGSAPRGVDWDSPTPAPKLQHAKAELASPYLAKKKAAELAGKSPRKKVAFKKNTMLAPGRGFGSSSPRKLEPRSESARVKAARGLPNDEVLICRPVKEDVTTTLCPTCGKRVLTPGFQYHKKICGAKHAAKKAGAQAKKRAAGGGLKGALKAGPEATICQACGLSVLQNSIEHHKKICSAKIAAAKVLAAAKHKAKGKGVKGAMALKFEAVICPDCGFSALKNSFAHHRKICSAKIAAAQALEKQKIRAKGRGLKGALEAGPTVITCQDCGLSVLKHSLKHHLKICRAKAAAVAAEEADKKRHEAKKAAAMKSRGPDSVKCEMCGWNVLRSGIEHHNKICSAKTQIQKEVEEQIKKQRAADLTAHKYKNVIISPRKLYADQTRASPLLLKKKARDEAREKRQANELPPLESQRRKEIASKSSSDDDDPNESDDDSGSSSDDEVKNDRREVLSLSSSTASTAPIVIKLDANFDEIMKDVDTNNSFQESFKNSMSKVCGVPASRFAVQDLTPGSVVVKFVIKDPDSPHELSAADAFSKVTSDALGAQFSNFMTLDKPELPNPEDVTSEVPQPDDVEDVGGNDTDEEFERELAASAAAKAKAKQKKLEEQRTAAVRVKAEREAVTTASKSRAKAAAKTLKMEERLAAKQKEKWRQNKEKFDAPPPGSLHAKVPKPEPLNLGSKKPTLNALKKKRVPQTPQIKQKSTTPDKPSSHRKEADLLKLQADPAIVELSYSSDDSFSEQSSDEEAPTVTELTKESHTTSRRLIVDDYGDTGKSGCCCRRKTLAQQEHALAQKIAGIARRANIDEKILEGYDQFLAGDLTPEENKERDKAMQRIVGYKAQLVTCNTLLDDIRRRRGTRADTAMQARQAVKQASAKTSLQRDLDGVQRDAMRQMHDAQLPIEQIHAFKKDENTARLYEKLTLPRTATAAC